MFSTKVAYMDFTSFTLSDAFALLIPLTVLLVGALGKKLVRGAGRWRRQDFYVGIQLSLAAMASGFAYLADLFDRSPIPRDQSLTTLGFVLVALLLFMVVVAIHQDWEDATESVGEDTRSNPKHQFWWLGFGANAVGITLLASFVLLIKGSG